MIPRQRDPAKEAVSRGPKLHCSKISESYPLMENLVNKKPSKVPAFYGANDKNKNIKTTLTTRSQFVECRFCKFCNTILLVSMILSHF